MSVRMSRTLRAASLALASVLVWPLVACSGSDEVHDELQVVENPTAATAPPSPETTTAPEGVVLGTDAGVPVGDVTALTTDPDTGVLAVAARDPDQVLLYDLETLDAPGREPTTVVELPGPAEQLAVLQNTLVATVPSANVLARISLPDGELHTTSVPGRPTGVASFGDRLLVSLREGKGIGVVEDDHVVSTIKGGLNSADDVVVVDGHTIVLDRLRSAVFTVDVDGQDIGEGLRAGQGAANIVADAFGRVFTTDTRRSAVLAFSTDPLLLRQLYPVPGGAYALAYDAQRHLLWVTLPARNEVVGFDVRGGEPVEKHRYPTLRQPNSITVEERTSRVVIGSAAGEGIQVIAP
jgi:hypothetical protein